MGKAGSGTDTGSSTAAEKDKGKGMAASVETRTSTPREESPEDQNPPDGDRQPGDVTEWREGPHLVIERDEGAGNEVKVEVIPNASTARQDPARTFRGRREHVRAEVSKFMQKLKEIPGAAEREAEHEVKQSKQEAVHIRDEAEEGLRDVAENVGLAGPSDETHDYEHADEKEEERSNDLEEEWHDDDAAVRAEETAGSSSSKKSPEKRASKPRYKVTPRTISKPSRTSALGKGRRLSFLGARPPKATRAASPAEEDTRGRDMTKRTLPATTGRRLTDSISRLRFEPTRAESPARSIRFADQQPPSGTQTPVGDRPTSSAGHGDETPLRVAFDVPDNRRR